jgi:hypothetical protein
MSKGKAQKNLPSQKPTEDKPLESSGVSDSRYIKRDDKFYSLKEAAEFRGTDEAGIIQHAIDCRTFIYLSTPDGRETRVTKKDLITFLAKPKISIKFSELRETFADYLSALEGQCNDDYRDGIKSSEKPFDTELKSIRAQYFKRASDCDYQVSTNNFKIYKHDLDLTKYESYISQYYSLEEADSKISKWPGNILDYASHGDIKIYYILDNGYFQLEDRDVHKFIVDINRKLKMPSMHIGQADRSRSESRRERITPSNSEYVISVGSLRILKKEMLLLEKQLEAENNKEDKRKRKPRIPDKEFKQLCKDAKREGFTRELAERTFFNELSIMSKLEIYDPTCRGYKTWQSVKKRYYEVFPSKKSNQ